MRWGARITDTAKISVEVRFILLKKVDGVIEDLHSLRRRANQYTSSATFTAFAAQVPLPKASWEEYGELDDPDFVTPGDAFLSEEIQHIGETDDYSMAFGRLANEALLFCNSLDEVTAPAAIACTDELD